MENAQNLQVFQNAGLPSETPGHSISSFLVRNSGIHVAVRCVLTNVGLTRGKHLRRGECFPGGYSAPLKYTVRSLHAHFNVLRSLGG
jgi:hypothetical protein